MFTHELPGEDGLMPLGQQFDRGKPFLEKVSPSARDTPVYRIPSNIKVQCQ